MVAKLDSTPRFGTVQGTAQGVQAELIKDVVRIYTRADWAHVQYECLEEAKLLYTSLHSAVAHHLLGRTEG